MYSAVICHSGRSNIQSTFKITPMISKSSHVAFAKKLVFLLDMKFTVFGFKFGIDPLFQFIPFVGNNVSTCASLYLFWIAFLYKVPTHVYLTMLSYIGIDYVLGFIPYIGFIGDFVYRSNIRSWELLTKYIDPEVLQGEVV